MNEMYLSSVELEELGEGLVKAYQKGEQKDDQVDTEGFIRDYLKLPIEYAKFIPACTAPLPSTAPILKKL